MNANEMQVADAIDDVQVVAAIDDVQVIEPMDNDTEDLARGTTLSKHYRRILKKVEKEGKNKGKEIIHFKCIHCNRAPYQGPQTTAILNHIRTSHKSKLDAEELPSTSNRQSTKEAVERMFQKSNKPFDEDILLGKIMRWIICRDIAFNTIDDTLFQDILLYLNKNVKICSRRTLMRKIEELYMQKKEELKQKLQSLRSKYSISCDLWTSKNSLTFFGFTIHYIDENWDFKEGLLAFKYLEGDHDGKSLSEAVIELLEEYEIADRLLGVTLDNASNNTTMMLHLESYYDENYESAGFSVNWNKVECLAHVLNLGAQQILDQFKQNIDEDYQDSDSNENIVSALSRLAYLVRKIRDSPKMRRIMMAVCQEKNMEYYVPIIDVKTRWNSTFDMVQRAITMREVIQQTIYSSQNKRLISLVLNDTDWKCMEDLLEILGPLKEATLIVSRGGASLSMSVVLPIFHYCIKSLEEHMKKYDESDEIYIGLQNAVSKLVHYYDGMSPIATIATILNPSMKTDFLVNDLEWSKEWMDNSLNLFRSSYDYYKQNRVPLVAPISSTTVSSSGGYQLLKKRKTNASAVEVEEEMTRYLNAPLKLNSQGECDIDVLAYWKTYEADFPILSAMARDYLTVQASSVPAERAFSSGTDLVTPERCSLSGKTIEMVQYLKFNLK